MPVNREQLIEWLLSLREGDIHDKKYQARLFDTFLIAAYLYDDGTAKLVFSFAGDKNTVTVPLAEAVDSVEENTAEGSFKLGLAPPEVHRNFDRITVDFFYAQKPLEIRRFRCFSA